MSEKMKISLPIIVEGRYDKSTLLGFISATVLTTDGFAVFNNKEKQALLRRICADGAIVLTDSDGGGRQIRAFLSGVLPQGKLHHLYIPEIRGKERRKTKGSAAGTLGVEGMSREVLERVLAPFIEGAEHTDRARQALTTVDMYALGLTGGDNSAAMRDTVAAAAGLPHGMSAKALLAALNILYSHDEAIALIEKTV